MTTYSNSKLSCFEQCPLKFKFNYIDQIETEIEETVEGFLGSRVHEALEKLYQDLKFQKLNTLQELLDFFNNEWKKNWNDGIVIVRDEYDQENYRKMGEKFISDYYKRYEPFNHTVTIGLETQNFVQIGDYNIHVRIDRLAIAKDGSYEIHDYKTSNSLPPQDKLDSDRQLAIYAYGVKTMYPDAKKVKLIWHYLAFDKEMSSERTEDQLVKLKVEVLETIKEIEGCEEYPPKTSALCKWCEFRPECPNFKHLYSIEDKSVEEFLKDDGVKIVNEFAALKAEIDSKSEALEELREKLIKFAKKKKLNVVYGSDIKASINSYIRLCFPKKEDRNREAFFKAVKKIGLWDQLATVDTYELASMINNKEINEGQVDLLDKYITEIETNMVRVSKS